MSRPYTDEQKPTIRTSCIRRDAKNDRKGFPVTRST